MIKFQPCAALTSHFENFWSIVQRGGVVLECNGQEGDDYDDDVNDNDEGIDDNDFSNAGE